MMGTAFNEATCTEIQAFIESQKTQIQIKKENQTYDLDTMFQRYFRCGFKETFNGALNRVFSGINAVKHFEVTMMRKYESDNAVSFCRSGESTCFIAEFSLRVNGIGKKMINGQSLDDSMKEAMENLRKDVSSLLKPKVPERITRKNLKREDIDRVKMLKNPKMKLPGSHVVPYAASVLTILVLGYKYVYIKC